MHGIVGKWCAAQVYNSLHLYFNPYPAKLLYLNFHPLVVVSRYRDPQLQVAEKIFPNNDAKTEISFPITVICSTNRHDKTD